MQNKQKNILYNLFISRKHRPTRHFILLTLIGIIAINGTFSTYNEVSPLLKNKIYWLLLSTLAINTIIVYLNLFLFVPKLLLRNKYIQYIITLAIYVLILILVDSFFELYVFKICHIGFKNSFFASFIDKPFLGFINTFVLSITSLIGISMPVLFKNWAIDKERINLLEKEELQSELETIKSRISPSFLSKTLRKTAAITIESPTKASQILLQLSKVLRYQLYDSSHEYVILKSEVDFITNYLNLEKTTNEEFSFQIDTEGNTVPVLVPPLLLLPIVTEFTHQAASKQESLHLNIHLVINKDKLNVTCRSNNNDTVNYREISNNLKIILNRKYVINSLSNKELTIQIDL